jgi:hypothetical protein
VLVRVPKREQSMLNEGAPNGASVEGT